MEVMSAAHQAVELEDLEALRDALDAGHDVHEMYGHITLLDHAVDTEADGHAQTGLPLCADVTAYLLARGADPLRSLPGQPTTEHQAFNVGHWLALDLFASWKKQHGKSSVVEPPNIFEPRQLEADCSRSPMSAVHEMDLELLRQLIDEGADPNKDYGGMPLLHHAIDVEATAHQQGCGWRLTMTAYLLARGADPQGVDRHERLSALQHARARGHWPAETVIKAHLNGRS